MRFHDVKPLAISPHLHLCIYVRKCTQVMFVFLLSSSVDFVLGPKDESLLQCYDRWRGWADPKVCCDYSFHAAVTWWSEQVSKEMEVLVKEKGSYRTYIQYYLF